MSVPRPVPPPAASTLPYRDLALVALGSVVLLSVTLVSPFGRDQGNYAYAAWAWLKGAALYRDVFVFKPPGTVLIHALALSVFGHSMTSIRLLDLVWQTMTALVTAASARRIGEDRPTSVIAGLLFPFGYAQQNYWTTAQTDAWMCLPVAFAIYAVLRVRSARGEAAVAGWVVASGLGLGISVPMKYTAAAGVLPLLVLLVYRCSWRSGVARLGIFTAAVLVPIVACGVWLWGSGAWAAFLDCQSGLVGSYVSETRRFGLVEGTWQAAKDLLTNTGLWVVGPWFYVGVVFLLVRPGPDRWLRAAVPLLWFFAGLISCVGQGKMFMYHHLFFYPGMGWVAAAPIASVGLWVVRRVRWRGTPVMVAVAAAAIFVWASRFPSEYRHLFAVVPGPETLDHQWRHDRGYRNSSFSLADNLALADRLRKTTERTDRVFLWGFEPMVNFLAERQTVSRFLYNYPFAVSWGNPTYERELIDALSAAPPRVFIVSSGDATAHVTGNKDDSLALYNKFPALKAFVAARYGPAERIRRFDVYVRMDEP